MTDLTALFDRTALAALVRRVGRWTFDGPWPSNVFESEETA